MYSHARTIYTDQANKAKYLPKVQRPYNSDEFQHTSIKRKGVYFSWKADYFNNADLSNAYGTLLCMYLIMNGLLNWLKWSTGTANAFALTLMLHVTLEMAG